MKKCIVLVVLFLICISISSCSNARIGLTDMEIAKYLSKIDGLSEIGTEDYGIPCGKRGICISPEHCVDIIEPNSILYPNIRYYGINIVDLVSVKFENNASFNEYYHYYRYLDISHINTRYREYLGGSATFAYTLRIGNCSPEWTEWLEYNIPQNVYNEAHGIFNLYWFDPIDQKYEKSVYTREVEDKTEVYVVYHEISLFYGTDYISPYLLSEEMFEKMKTEFGDSFNADGYVKGTVSEFTNWFMGEYLKEVPSVFANIEEEVYYPRYGGGLNYSIYEADEIVPEMIADLEKLGVDFDEITSCIIKVTVPHNGEYDDIFWELIG